VLLIENCWRCTAAFYISAIFWRAAILWSSPTTSRLLARSPGCQTLGRTASGGSWRLLRNLFQKFNILPALIMLWRTRCPGHRRRRGCRLFTITLFSIILFSFNLFSFSLYTIILFFFRSGFGEAAAAC
jgi:hypothetical protein